MRLSNVLSTPPDLIFKQVEGFLSEKNLAKEQQRKIKTDAIGKVGLVFHCNKCKCDRFFCVQRLLYCIGVDDSTVSIDCILSCFDCKETFVPAWFLVNCSDKIAARHPSIRIQKRSFKLPVGVLLREYQYEGYSDFLQRARRAHSEGLGLGAAIYLRNILEKIVYKVAKEANVSTVSAKGNRLSFKDLWEKVDKAKHIVPAEFSKDGYQLFAKLSEIIHGNVEEKEALTKYQPLRRLVVAIIENVRNSPEILAAWTKLR